MPLNFLRSPEFVQFVIIEEELCAVRHAWNLREKEFVLKFADPTEQKAAASLMWQLPLIVSEGFNPQRYPMQKKLWLTLALGGLEILKGDAIAPHPCGHTVEKHKTMLQQIAAILTAKSSNAVN